jgi:hypothetical protein
MYVCVHLWCDLSTVFATEWSNYKELNMNRPSTRHQPYTGRRSAEEVFGINESRASRLEC